MDDRHYQYLDKINSPADLKRVPREDLGVVAAELRSFIIDEVAKHPGHLGSSLGVVELTVALHYVFDTPYDRIIWDVGHQAYGHKILTGRRDVFHTNRQLGGISGFPTPHESEYDAFGTGHASTSISAGLGMSVAALLKKDERRKVVAVIGDGAMTGGLAFEGLNNTSMDKNNLLIILNDNQMAIDPIKGGFSQYLVDITTSRTYEGLSVEPNASHTFTFNESLPAPTPGEPQNFTVSVTINKGESIQEEGCIFTQAYQPTKRVVTEELTGTWCGYCVRGIYYMEAMNENYPDNFIGIAVHGGDPMQVNSYMNYLSAYTTGYPFCMTMRDINTKGDPQYMPTFYNTHINKPAWADVSIYAEWADENKTSMHTQTATTFATSGNNIGMQLALVIIENDVNKPGDSNYNQANYYSGGGMGPMGGFESLPASVPAAQMYYQEVARAIYDDIETGIIGSIPNDVERDVTYKYYRELNLPSNVLVSDNCQVVALLIDTQSGKIVNAAKCDISDYNSAVTATKGDAFASRAYRTGDGIRVEADLTTSATTAVEVYAMDGTLVYKAQPRKAEGLTTIDCPVKGRGAYIVRVTADGNVQTHKVIL